MEIYVSMKETNDRIVACDTVKEAREIIAQYERDDKLNDEYEPDTYCITDGHFHELDEYELKEIEKLDKEQLEKHEDPYFEPKTVKEFMKHYDLTITNIMQMFNIPYRTIQHWVSEGADHRECPDYVLAMMNKIMRLL